MPYALPDTALVTPRQVYDAQKGGVRIDLPRDEQAIGEIVEAVSAEVGAYLDRTLIVAEHTDRVAWAYDCDEEGYASRLYSRQWPLVAVPEGYTLADDGRRFVASSETWASGAANRIAYTAGYRRADQTGDAPVLPADIVRFAIDAVLYRWNEADAGIGQRQTEVDTGTGIVRRTGVEASWWTRNAPRINRHRFLSP